MLLTQLSPNILVSTPEKWITPTLGKWAIILLLVDTIVPKEMVYELGEIWICRRKSLAFHHLWEGTANLKWYPKIRKQDKNWHYMGQSTNPAVTLYVINGDETRWWSVEEFGKQIHRVCLGNFGWCTCNQMIPKWTSKRSEWVEAIWLMYKSETNIESAMHMQFCIFSVLLISKS